MTGEKKFRITVIAAVCAAALVAGTSRIFLNQTIPEHTPGNINAEYNTEQTKVSEIKGERKEVVIGEETILTAVQESIEGKLKVSDLAVTIKDNAVVTLTGTVSKADVGALLHTQNDSISSAYEAVLGLLPDSLPLEIRVQIQTINGTASVIPRSLKISSMEIPTAVVGDELFTAMSDRLNEQLHSQLSQVESISSKDGGLTVIGT